MPDPGQNKKIHHITHYSNLTSIIRMNGLYSSNILHTQDVTPTNIGHMSLKERRGQHPVDLPPGGTLNDYVPFFLGPRPPMIIAIAKGSVADYLRPQKEIIYLVSSIQTIVNAGCLWCFTDGHAVEAITEYYNNLGNLVDLDWDAIYAFDFRPTSADPDRSRKKQAEFLVHRVVQWPYIESITVKDIEMRNRVEEILNETHSPHRPTINIERNWYYNPRGRQE